MSLTFTNTNFKSEVLEAKELVFVDFWATWCGPCKMMTPHVEALAEEYAGKVKVGKINVDDNSEIATAYGIASIPCFILFKDGKQVDRKVGAMPKALLKQWIDSHL